MNALIVFGGVGSHEWMTWTQWTVYCFRFALFLLNSRDGAEVWTLPTSSLPRLHLLSFLLTTSYALSPVSQLSPINQLIYATAQCTQAYWP